MLNFYRMMSKIGTRKTPITITPQAWLKMENIALITNNNNFIFSATSGGCSGLNFVLEPGTVDKIKIFFPKESKLPKTIIENNNIKLYIDPLSEMYLLGTTIDFIKEDYQNGIYESKFLFTPDSTKAGTCGCGISFYLKE